MPKLSSSQAKLSSSQAKLSSRVSEAEEHIEALNAKIGSAEKSKV